MAAGNVAVSTLYQRYHCPPPPPPLPTVAYRALTGCGLVCSGLPGDLAQLRNLQTLDVAHNLISGGVPKDWVAPGAFAALQTLQLGALPATACH